MNAKKTVAQKTTDKQTAKREYDFVFGSENYILMIIGVVVIIIGFILMAGTEDIFDFRKITLAPIIILSGFVIELFAIMRKAKD